MFIVSTYYSDFLQISCHKYDINAYIHALIGENMQDSLRRQTKVYVSLLTL